MCSTVIETFWRHNPQYWITPPDKHAVVDKFITENYLAYDYTQENLVGQVIYLDQFSRHFARHGAIDETKVLANRRLALEKIYQDTSLLEAFDEFRIVWCMMVFKHLKHYNAIFTFLHDIWLKDRPIRNFPILQTFYHDTYKKAYDDNTVRDAILLPHRHSSLPSYDPNAICDFYPPQYQSPSWTTDLKTLPPPNLAFQSLFEAVPPHAFVSLSGGVDSMTMLTLLKLHGTPINAIHIVYGNRAESEDEYAFLASFCAKLDVPLYVYKIPYLRRADNDRTFYESMTRDLRFMAYRACATLANQPPTILLGHIQDDVVENIWTNLSKNQHLDNLPKMKPTEVQHGVTLLRPLLDFKKSTIYDASTLYSIPYLKNTTPAWCNRGKFRNHFHQATVDQYGPQIDTQISALAQSVQRTYQLVDDLLYKPIYQSYCPTTQTINIMPALQTTLDVSHWVQIITHMCHNVLHMHRPSIKAIHHFHERLYRPRNIHVPVLHVQMGSHLVIEVKNTTLRFLVR
jgi:tRNA(Ile)-lysidine synthetase-like protein